jgi:hypothetical protein
MMKTYVIKDYHKGVENDQALIGYQAAKHWVWPYAYDLDDLLAIHAQSGFDPETRHYCFWGEEMVGYIFSTISIDENREEYRATIDFPRMLPGHQQAADLLVKAAMERLKDKGVSCIVGRVTDMCPADIELAEKFGFSIFDWGYKLYYSYEMAQGELDYNCEGINDIDLDDPDSEILQQAVVSLKRPADWCKKLLADWHAYGMIAHLGVREQGKLVASCLVAPNLVRPTTAGIYCIYASDAASLRKMLGKVIQKCIASGTINLISDLINEHRVYESVYKDLGFEKVAKWARCELRIS